MPKLSQFLEQAERRQAATHSHQAAVWNHSQAPTALPESAPVAAAPGPPPASPVLDSKPSLTDELGQAAARLKQQYERRVKEHGARLFRHPDGSLRPDRPAPNPYAVANRKHWHPLVTHCRTVGRADKDYQQKGHSLRYDINVGYEQHKQLLASTGLQPEYDSMRQWYGYQPGLDDPLEDPQHPFNTHWRQVASTVFASAPFQWHHGIQQ